MDEEQIEGRRRNYRLDDDFAGAEPVELFAAVEHDLEPTDRDAQGPEAEPIELRAGFARRFRQKDHDADQIDNADRQVDIEDIAPAVIFSEPAAEHRAENGPDHHPDAEQRHGEALAFTRITAEQDGLRQRNKRCAERALQHPEQHELRQRLRHAAQHGSDGESRNGNEEKPPDTEPAGEKAGRRRHDRGGDDVGGQHPGDLVLAGRDAALHIRQRDVGDRGVERLHECRKDHADG